MPGQFPVLSLVLILGFAGRVSAQVADPAPSPELAYQGRLTESNALVTGTRPFVFSILDSTGIELWNSGPQNLTVVEGLYGIVLGATGMPAISASLTLRANLHLHVLADGVALSPDISLIPALQASTSWSVTGPFFGDISGTQQGISVDKLKGIPIDLTGLTAGRVLTFDGTSWTASAAAGGGQGPQGPAGPTGATGANGRPGSPGPAGPTGATGPPGPAGAVGTTGAPGTNGSGFNFRNAFDASASYAVDDVATFSGSTYLAIAASTGPGNPTPDTNPSAWTVMAREGVAGTAGAPGSAGPPGSAGAPGATGAPGLQGPPGPTGSQGPAGPTGTNGGGFNFRNAFDASASYAIDDVATFGGSTYLAIAANSGPSNPTPPANSSAWTVMAQEGAAGTAGAPGSAGAPGATGAPGLQGPPGPTGPQGPAGTNGSGFNFRNAFDASASYAIGDVATFSGSTYLAIATSTGPSNPTPPANPSAWTVMAQEGAAGTTGAPGSAGAPGATGSQGPTGSTGSNGSPGSTGPPGPAGASPFTLDGSDAVFTTGSVGIGVDPPSATAALDVTSTTKGLLAPRMTTVERLAITSPANGLIVFDTDTKSLEVYDAVGAVWSAASGGTVTSVSATSPISVATGTTTPAISLGTVPVANGGTGATTLTGYLLGAGTTAVTASATIPGTAISGNISGNAASVTGTVAIANGGTGAATATASATNLLPPQAGNAGKALTTNGTVASWGAGTVGTVTSVTGTSPIVVATGTTTPAISLSTVPVASGGTGATTFAQGAILFGTTTTPIAGATGLFWDSVHGFLGVGTTTPAYPFQVASSVSANIGAYGFLNSSSTGTASGVANVSIYGNGRVVAQEVDAISDARIKNVIGLSDPALDLETLKKLRITNYRYVDVAGRGNQPKKGVIAQEVEKVYPDAVRTVTDFIPSVYVMADDVRYDAAAQELTVIVPKAHGFAVGDIVRIITADAGNVDKPVTAVFNDDTFVLSGVEKPSRQVFVFGKRVDDFRVVDYDQLFSMNLGATQQLAAENRALKARVAALEQAVAVLQKQK